jgi:hypothetical protein
MTTPASRGAGSDAMNRQRLSLLVTALCALACAEPDHAPEYPGDVDLPRALRPSGDEFLVVVIPDTQVYAERFPETFASQMRWIAEHADEYNIVFVSHVGDIVEDGTREVEWTAATAAYEHIWDLRLPHGQSPASHDKYDSAPGYTQHFGPDNYTSDEWYRGTSPSGFSNFQVVDAGGMELLFLHLHQNPTQAEVDWGNEVLDAHPGTLAHLTTHQYLYDYRLTSALPAPLNLVRGGRFSGFIYSLGGQDLPEGRLSTTEVWEQLVAPHGNIWAVHCGHVDAEFRQTATNESGLTVHEVLVDFQDMSDGGGGWLRLLRFKPSENQVEAITFSTLTGELRGNGDGFEHSIGILEAYRTRAADALADFGVSDEVINTFLRDVNTEGHATRDAYYESLYGFGSRDSQFVMDVDFAAHIAASQ